MAKKYMIISVSWLLSILLAIFLTGYVVAGHFTSEPVGGFDLEEGVVVTRISGETLYEFSNGTSAVVREETRYRSDGEITTETNGPEISPQNDGSED